MSDLTDQMNKLTEDHDLEWEEIELESESDIKKSFRFEGDMSDIVSVVDGLDLDDSQNLVYEVFDDFVMMLVKEGELSTLELSSMEADALISDPTSGCDREYRFSEEDNKFVVSAEKVDHDYLKEEFGILFDLTDAMITDIFYDGEWVLTSKLTERVDDLLEYRVRELIGSEIIMYCPNCGYELWYSMNDFCCSECMSYFVQPDLLDGVKSTDLAEEIEEKIEDNFVVNPDLDVEDLVGVKRNSFLFDDTVPSSVPSIVEREVEEDNKDFPPCEKVGFTEEYPPVLFEGDELMVKEDGPMWGTCYFTGEDATEQLRFGMVQEFDGFMCISFIWRDVSPDVFQYIQNELGL